MSNTQSAPDQARPNLQDAKEDLLRQERNLIEFILGLQVMLRSLPEQARGAAKIKAELVYGKDGKDPFLAFRVNF